MNIKNRDSEKQRMSGFGTIDLVIDDLGAQGDGIAHHDGRTYFVPGALPQERVRACVIGQPDKQCQTRLLDILESSPVRVAPSCPHYPNCGGCRLLHMDAKAVTDWKVNSLVSNLCRNSLISAQNSISTPSISPPKSRFRARLAAQNTGAAVVLGFNGWRSHTIVDMTLCAILRPELMSFINMMRGVLHVWLQRGHTCDIQITSLPEGFDVVLIGGPELGLEQREQLAQLADKLDISQLSWRRWDRSLLEPIAYRRPLSISFGSTSVPFPPGSFLQATREGGQALINFALHAIDKIDKVMDLFCGLGGFGLSIPHARTVHFADLDGQAIESLQQSVRSNPNHVVERRNLIRNPYKSRELEHVDAIIFDPPRGGCKAQAIEISHSHVPVVVSISCDPASFIRDAQILIQGGYKIHQLQAVDQFLGSTHLEVAAAFRKNA